MTKRNIYTTPADNAYRRNPIKLTIEGAYLSPEHYITVKSKCEKFRQELLDYFDGVEFGFPEEIFTSIETEQTIRGEG